MAKDSNCLCLVAAFVKAQMNKTKLWCNQSRQIPAPTNRTDRRTTDRRLSAENRGSGSFAS